MSASAKVGMLLQKDDLIGFIMSFDDNSVIRGDAHVVTLQQYNPVAAHYHIHFAEFQSLPGQTPLLTLNQKLQEFAAA